MEFRAGDLAGPLARKMLADGRSVALRVTGSSMWPLVRPGDVIVARPAADRQPRFGQVVITASDEGRLLVHRLVGRRGHAWLTRGDGAGTADAPVRPEDVLALVVEVERNGRTRTRGLGRAGGALLAVLSRAGVLAALGRAWWSVRRLAPLRRRLAQSDFKRSGRPAEAGS